MMLSKRKVFQIIIVIIFWGLPLQDVSCGEIFTSHWTQKGARAWSIKSNEWSFYKGKHDTLAGDCAFKENGTFDKLLQHPRYETDRVFVGWKYANKGEVEQNQDRLFIEKIKESIYCFGVFDGAGDANGEQVALDISEAFKNKFSGLQILLDKSNEDVKKILCTWYKEINAEFMNKKYMQLLEEEGEDPIELEDENSNTTSIIAFTLSDKLIVGCLGDLRALLVKNDGTFEQLSREDNGMRFRKRDNPIGNAFEEKLRETIVIRNIAPGDFCLILMTDGVYNEFGKDTVDQNTALTDFVKQLKDKKEKTNEYAKKLIERATALVNQEYKNKCESYVRDDMSVICIFFPQALAKQIAVLREQLTLLHEKLNSLKAALEVLKAGL